MSSLLKFSNTACNIRSNIGLIKMQAPNTAGGTVVLML